MIFCLCIVSENSVSPQQQSLASPQVRNENRSLKSIRQQMVPLGTPVVIPFEPNDCPSAFCQLPLRESLVKTRFGWSFLSNLFVDSGHEL